MEEETKQGMDDYACFINSRILIVLTFSIVSVWLAQYLWNRRNLYRLSAKIPGPPGYPIIGNALEFIGDSEKKFQKLLSFFDSYPDVFKFSLGPIVVYGISKPEHVEIILNHPQCLSKSPLYDYIKRYMGNGLVTAPVHIWKKNRKLINPAFNQKVLDGFVEVFNEQARILLDILKKNIDKKDLDIFPIIRAYNLDTFCETAMGVKVNAQTTSNPYGEMLDRIMEVGFLRSSSLWYRFEVVYKCTELWKTEKEVIPKLMNFTEQVVSEKKKLFLEKMEARQTGEIIEEDSKWKSFLDLLIELSYEGTKLSDEELRDEVNTLMAAGSDTTAASICYCFLTMGMFPQIQKKVYEEVIEVLGEDRDVYPEDLPRLQYMERFIKETMRLFPIAAVYLRSPTVDVDLGDVLVPANCNLLIGAIHFHRSPKYWKDPLKFDPDRFLPEEVAKRHPYSYLPFSGGPRGCIGSKYAIMAMKSILAIVVRQFVMKTEYKTIEEVKFKFHLLLRTAEGFKVSFERRR